MSTESAEPQTETVDIVLDRIVRYIRFQAFVVDGQAPDGTKLRILRIITGNGDMLEFPMPVSMADKTGRELQGSALQRVGADALGQLAQQMPITPSRR